MFRQAAVVFLVLSPLSAAQGATMAPPLLDITRQCDANSRHNATAMSECVVAESEARSEILQRWSTFPDASAERCVKAGRKAKRYPYATIAKCLSDEAIGSVQPPPLRAGAAGGAPAPVAAVPTAVPTLAAPPSESAGESPFRTFKNRLFGTGK